MKAESEVIILQKYGTLNRRVTQKQPLADIFKIGVLKKIRDIYRKIPALEYLFIKVLGLSPCNFVKCRLQHRLRILQKF